MEWNMELLKMVTEVKRYEESTHLQITVLIDENVRWFQITVDNTGRVCILESALLYKRTGGGLVLNYEYEITWTHQYLI